MATPASGDPAGCASAATPKGSREPITLHVDATDVIHHVFTVDESIQLVGQADLTLLYPAWMPGNHSPRGPLQNLGGLRMSVDGVPVEWRRDPLDVWSFHVRLPRGARRLDVHFQFLSPTATDQGRVTWTRAIGDLQWNAVLLYPAGAPARGIPIAPSLRLPDGWSHATSLEVAPSHGEGVRFASVSLERLIDSPVFFGRYAKSLQLADGDRPVRLNLFADSPDLISISEAQIEAHRAIVRQADLIFGSRPFCHYDFLVGLSEVLGTIGLEHQSSSEDVTDARYFADWASLESTRTLLAHEYVHAWNGKYRRPDGLLRADYNTPTDDSLVWVYEGLTQYLEVVLSARAGMVSREQTLEALANTAAAFDKLPGRSWRPLADTTYSAVLSSRRPLPWPDWQRYLDYYDEGTLLWLEADTLIRKRSRGARSLDDFLRAFFAGPDGVRPIRPYGYADLVAALSKVEPNDWDAFFQARLTTRGAGPLGGVREGGYELDYGPVPTAYLRDLEKRQGLTDLSYSIGLVVDRAGLVKQVSWEGPAFIAGLNPGMQLAAVNGDAYAADRLKQAIVTAQTSGAPIALLVKSEGAFRTLTVGYRGGLRYPYLRRREGTAPVLDEILAPRSR